jgi:hypothetical protein
MQYNKTYRFSLYRLISMSVFVACMILSKKVDDGLVIIGYLLATVSGIIYILIFKRDLFRALDSADQQIKKTNAG